MISFGVDIGGTGCKCVAFSEDGTQLALTYCEYPVKSGTVNLPVNIFTSSVFQVIAQCTEKISRREEISAITVSSFGESFVALDQEGNALTDIMMYFGDTQSVEFFRLVEEIGKKKFMEIARILPDASYSLSKMLYTQKIADRPVWKYLFIAGYICYKLSGKVCTDVSLACRSLLYDVKKNKWSEELVNACGISASTLPQICPTGTAIGPVLPEIAETLGLPKNVQVVLGAHDQIVNALGAGVAHIGDAVDTSGTCECLTPLFADIPEQEAFLKDNYACVPYLNYQGYVTYAYNISAGSVVRWYRDTLAGYLREEAEQKKVSIYDLLNQCCPLEPTNLIVLPFLQGMGGTPEADSTATGMIAGLTTQTRLPDIYRAILEGITFEMRYNQERLNAGNIQMKKLYACGGGAKSAVWLQIKADILGSAIIPVQREETGAMGSAILGLAALKNEDPLKVAESFWSYGAPIYPNPEHQQIYDEKYKKYKAMRELYHACRP